jgi:hypothetical protein
MFWVSVQGKKFVSELFYCVVVGAVWYFDAGVFADKLTGAFVVEAKNWEAV